MYREKSATTDIGSETIDIIGNFFIVVNINVAKISGQSLLAKDRRSV